MKKEFLYELAEYAKNSREELHQAVKEELEKSIFENRYTPHPRQLNVVSVEEVDNFIAYLLADDQEQLAEELGRRRAREGLGVKPLLGVGHRLREHLFRQYAAAPWPKVREVLAFVDEYTSQCLAGYFQEQEGQLLQDQEQLRKALADALEQQRRELLIKNHAIHTSINGIMLTDMEGKITYLNPAFVKMWGYENADEIIGMKIADFWGADRAKVITGQLPYFEGWHSEMTARRKDGTTTEVSVSASLIRDETDLPLGIMASFVDITERKRLESQFRQAQKMEALGQLASSIVHDVNNLLTAISGYAQLELAGREVDSSTYRSMMQIKTATDRGRSLTRQLRVFTRQATGERQAINLNEIVEETHALLKRTFPPDLTINLNLDPDLKYINADSSQMSQLLMNLSVNARDAMSSCIPAAQSNGKQVVGGTLTITTKNVLLDTQQASRYLAVKPGEYVCIQVSDTGVGMTQEVKERLFEPFFTTKGERSGSGLGLAVVYGIVQTHQGFIDVNSTLGEGSVFEIYLPVAAYRTKEAAVPPRLVSVLVNGTGTILVVEDESYVREMIVQTLERCGYKVMCAENGLVALELYKIHRDEIALVVLDMLMPKMGGRDCFLELRKVNPQVKVIVMTGYTAEDVPRQLLDDGVAAYVEKPLDLRQFTQKVKDIIST